MKGCIVVLVLISLVAADISTDKMTKIPGFGSFNTSIYSGYLSTKSDSRKLHYLFVESVKGTNNSDPVTLWLNGGPGCSSLLGFIQEIGPYYLEDGKNYTDGDNLTFNAYSWHNVSNLLFLESPAGVGFSYNLDTKYSYNDTNVAQDNLEAVKDFFKNYPEYAKANFFIAGESYAGKYIPDLGVQIDKYNLNASSKINLKGLMIGNGVMDFTDGELEKSSVQYMLDKDFADPELVNYWKTSCQTDPESAGCNYFFSEFEEDISELNPYNVYGYCFYNSTMNMASNKRFLSQSSTLKDQLRTNFPHIYGKNSLLNSQERTKLGSGNKYNANAPCAFFDGMSSYFNTHSADYNAKWKGMEWNGPCAENISYTIDLAGSMASYRYLLSRLNIYTINLYNGDWDDVVPYVDTLKHMKKLNLEAQHSYNPWFVNNQHAGFNQLWSGILYTTVKGASHQVPQAKRAEGLQLLVNMISGHG